MLQDKLCNYIFDANSFVYDVFFQRRQRWSDTGLQTGDTNHGGTAQETSERGTDTWTQRDSETLETLVIHKKYTWAKAIYGGYGGYL